MANRGGQPGNTNASKNKPWHYAIQRALRKRSRSDQLEALDELAEKFLDAVETGDIQAFKELGDRLDGKPAQAITGADGGPLSVNVVRFAGSIAEQDGNSNAA